MIPSSADSSLRVVKFMPRPGSRENNAIAYIWNGSRPPLLGKNIWCVPSRTRCASSSFSTWSLVISGGTPGRSDKRKIAPSKTMSARAITVPLRRGRKFRTAEITAGILAPIRSIPGAKAATHNIMLAIQSQKPSVEKMLWLVAFQTCKLHHAPIAASTTRGNMKPDSALSHGSLRIAGCGAVSASFTATLPIARARRP